MALPNGIGQKIDISDKKMYQLGNHYNKHGRLMGFSDKVEYELAARDFFYNNQNIPEIYRGNWNNSRGNQSGQVQLIIRHNGMQLIINQETGQIIDFYEGISLDGFINIERMQ